MTCRLIANNSRPCDGQPGRMCPSDCDVDCDFNSRTLDRVMNYPLRRVQANEFPALVPPRKQPTPWYKRPPSMRTFAKLGAALFVAVLVVKFVVHAFKEAGS